MTPIPIGIIDHGYIVESKYTEKRPKIILSEIIFREIIEDARKRHWEDFPDLSKSLGIEFDRDLVSGTRKIGIVDVIYRYGIDDTVRKVYNCKDDKEHSGCAVGTYPAYRKFDKIFVVLDIVDLDQEGGTDASTLFYTIYATAYEAFHYEVFGDEKYKAARESGDFFASEMNIKEE